MLQTIEIPGIALEAELGRGAHSVVYLGRHRGGACAVKIPRVRGRWTRWVYREAVAFARLRHPGLPHVLEVGQADDLPYLVTELVRGETLAERLALGPLPAEEVIDLGIHLADMLATVHDAGLIHRDVKPCNVMVDVKGAMRLLDFGFAVPLERAAAANDGGTVDSYAAPEQLRVPARVDCRADLYALGLVLFESLTQALPATTDVEKIQEELIAHAVDPALIRVLCGLLPHNAQRRYPDARALLADLDIAGGGNAPRGPHAYVASPAVSGLLRTAELQRMAASFGEVELGTGRLLVVEGTRGSGKSHLLDAHAAEVRLRRRPVVELCCREGDAPLAVARRLFESGLRVLESEAIDGYPDPSGSGQVVPEHLRPFAAALSPAFAQLFGPAPSSVMLGTAFAEGAAECLLSLAQQLSPALITVDDAQWVDGASGDILARLAHRVAETRVLLVIAARSASQASLVARAKALGGPCIDLPALGTTEVEALLADHLGEPSIARAITPRIMALADATPLGIVEVVGALLDGGALQRRAGGWSLDAERAEGIALPDGALAVLGRRVAEVPAATRHVLEAASVVGLGFDDSFLGQLLELDPRDLDFGLADARRAGLIQIDGTGDHRFVHDSLRELLLREIPPLERGALHQRIADLLGRSNSVSTETLCSRARHSIAAGLENDPERAFRVVLGAANAALDAFDNETALQFFAQARTAADLAGLPLDEAYHRSVGEAHLRLGDVEGSLASFQEALTHARDLRSRGQILGRIAWAHQTIGKAESAWEALDQAFRAVGARMPVERAGTIATTLVEIARAQLSRHREASAPSDRHADLDRELLCELHYQNARLGLDYGKPLRFVQSTLQAVQLTHDNDVSRGSVRATAFYGLLLTVFGMGAIGAREMTRARKIADALGQPEITAYCVQLRALTACYAGDFDSALVLLRECIDEYGAWLELNEYCLNVLNAEEIESVRGRADEAAVWIERAIGRLRRTPRAPAAFVTAMCIRAVAAREAAGLGASEDAWLAEQVARQLPSGEPGRLYRLMSWGPRARILFTRSATKEEFDGLVAEFGGEGYSTRVPQPVLWDYYIAVAHARLVLYRAGDPGERPALLGDAQQAAKDLRAIAKLPLPLAHSRVVDAQLARIEGSTKRASKLLSEAEDFARLQTCSWAMSEATRARARISREDGRHAPARDLARVAEVIARNHGARGRANSIRAEFDLPGDVAPTPPARPSTLASLAHRQIAAILTIGRVPERLDVEHDAAAFVGEILGHLGASRGAILFSPDSTTRFVVSRDRQGVTSANVDGWREALLLRTRDRREVWPAPGHEPESQHILAAPLMLRDRPLGAMLFEREPSSPEFQASDRELLSGYAHVVPIILEACRLLGEREELQTSVHRTQKMDALGQLAGRVAHDLNNLLTVLQSSANILRDRAEHDAEARADVDVILQATGRATQLARQLLTFSRHRPLPFSAHNPNELLSRLEPALRATAGTDVDVTLCLAIDAYAVRTEKVAFEQAMLHLAENARDAMPAGGSLAIETRKIEADRSDVRRGAPAPGDYVCISFVDNGVGMAPDLVARVFEPFFTTRESRNGLGLSTVYAFAKNSGGWVELSSEVDRGTAVRVYLPRALTSRALTSSAPPQRSSSSPATNKIILVVDDEEMLRRTVQRMLERAGYRVLVADGGVRALELVEKHKDEIGLAILDVLMPGMSGPELGRRLAKLGAPAKIFYMSGFAPDSVLNDDIPLEDARVLQKPFTPTQLLDRVRRAVEADE